MLLHPAMAGPAGSHLLHLHLHLLADFDFHNHCPVVKMNQQPVWYLMSEQLSTLTQR